MEEEKASGCSGGNISYLSGCSPGMVLGYDDLGRVTMVYLLVCLPGRLLMEF